MINPPKKTFGTSWARLVSSADDWADECKETTQTAFAATEPGPLDTVSGTINN